MEKKIFWKIRELWIENVKHVAKIQFVLIYIFPNI